MQRGMYTSCCVWLNRWGVNNVLGITIPHTHTHTHTNTYTHTHTYKHTHTTHNMYPDRHL